jgi:hypothetical protein
MHALCLRGTRSVDHIGQRASRVLLIYGPFLRGRGVGGTQRDGDLSRLAEDKGGMPTVGTRGDEIGAYTMKSPASHREGGHHSPTDALPQRGAQE